MIEPPDPGPLLRQMDYTRYDESCRDIFIKPDTEELLECRLPSWHPKGPASFHATRAGSGAIVWEVIPLPSSAPNALP